MLALKAGFLLWLRVGLYKVRSPTYPTPPQLCQKLPTEPRLSDSGNVSAVTKPYTTS